MIQGSLLCDDINCWRANFRKLESCWIKPIFSIRDVHSRSPKKPQSAASVVWAITTFQLFRFGAACLGNARGFAQPRSRLMWGSSPEDEAVTASAESPFWE